MLKRRAVVAMGVAIAALSALGQPVQAAPARNWTLVYQGTNKWVAADQNKSLRSVLKAAKDGATHFEVRLPAGSRDLSVARLEVLRDLMAREAKGGIIIEEIDGDVRNGTIWVGVK